MKIFRFILVALLTTLISGYIGYTVFGRLIYISFGDIKSILVAMLSSVFTAVLISFALGYLFAPFDSNKKYHFLTSYLLATGVFLAIAFGGIFVIWSSNFDEVSDSAALGLETLMVFTILCPPTTICALVVGLCIAVFARLGSKQKDKSQSDSI